MAQPRSVCGREQVVDTMIALTRLSGLHRAIVAGSDSMALYLSLRRRGFVRIATPVTGPLPKGQHTVALISGQGPLPSIEAALGQVAPFLSTNAAIAVLICSGEDGSSLKIRHRLEQMGFRIEAGVRCQDGLVLSACRQGVRQLFARQGFARIEQAA
jgi:hypothetical protein